MEAGPAKIALVLLPIEMTDVRAAIVTVRRGLGLQSQQLGQLQAWMMMIWSSSCR